jgi:hypothetical protein
MKDQIQTHKKQQEWKSVTVRLKEDELAILNNKLKINGFENFSQFILIRFTDTITILF